MTKNQILDALRAFVRQRPGLKAVDYDSRAAYQADYRRIRRHLRDFERLLSAVESAPEIGVLELQAAFRSAPRGRLTLTECADRGCALSYQTGSYFPTEYRAAACEVLAQALWDAARAQHVNGGLRAHFRRQFGAAMQRRWFD